MWRIVFFLVALRGFAAALLDNVDLFSGKLLYRQNALVVEAVEPISISHTHHSKTKDTYFFPHIQLRLDARGFFVEEPDGELVYYSERTGSTYRPQPSNHEREPISARNNPSNNALVIEGKRKIRILLPNGGSRFYYRPRKSKRGFLLHSEVLSNGRKKRYSYDKYSRLQRVETTSPDGSVVYAWAHFGYHDKVCVSLTTSNGQRVEYRFAKDQQGVNLQSVSSPYGNCASESFSHREQALTSYQINGHALLHIDYFKQRIAQLRSPTDNGKLIAARKFSYRDSIRDSWDAEGALTRYHFTPEHRLATIEFFDQSQHLHATQRMTHGLVKEKSLYDAAGKLVFSRKFHCDEAGNVLQDTFQDEHIHLVIQDVEFWQEGSPHFSSGANRHYSSNKR